MADKITNASVEEFLQDFENRSETFLLEEGKEKDDILEVATAKGYNLKNSHDLAGFKTIFTFANQANKNKARLPQEKLLKVLPGIIGKPVDIDHIRNYVVGHYIDYRYRAAENMVIAYGVFYKSNFGEEWATAQKLFKAGTLATSYEIWCPKDKRKTLPDGTYELTEMEIAGGGLMFKEKPAFAKAMVLELAQECNRMFEVVKQRSIESAAELVCASAKAYDTKDIVVSDTFKFKPSKSTVTDLKMSQNNRVDEVIGNPVNPKALPAGDVVAAVLPNTGTEPKRVNNDNAADNVAVPGPQIVAKITCAGCRKDFEDFGECAKKAGEVKCPNCFSILHPDGNIKHPPQIINFSMSCPSCRGSNWKILTNDENAMDLKCMSCAKTYKAEVTKPTANELLNKLSFVYTGSASCPQCSSHIPFGTTNKITNKDLTCSNCGLNFTVDISRLDSKKKISRITEVNEDNLTVSSEKGDNPMSETPIEAQAPAVEVVPVVPVANAEVIPETVPAVEVVAPVAPVVEPVVVPVVEVPVVAEVVEEEVSLDKLISVNCESVEISEFALEAAKTLKAEDRNALKDSDFAIVKTVKNEKTGEPRKIRMYPMHDEAHVKNALARINQKPSQKGLKKLGLSVEGVKAKIHARAKKMGIQTAEDNSGSNENKPVVSDNGTDMQNAEPREPVGPQAKASVETPVVAPIEASADSRVAGLVPDQVNQMQNQLFAEVQKNAKFSAARLRSAKRMKSLRASMKKASVGSSTDVKTDKLSAEDLAKMLAEGKPVKASAAGCDVTIKVEGKTAEELASMLAKGEPVMSSVNELNLAKDENNSLKERILLLESAAVKIIERRNVLGLHAKGLSEKDILDDDKFECARLKKENAELKILANKGSGHVSEPELERSSEDFSSKQKTITEKAFRTGKK